MLDFQSTIGCSSDNTQRFITQFQETDLLIYGCFCLFLKRLVKMFNTGLKGFNTFFFKN